MEIFQRDVVFLVDKFNRDPQDHPYIVLSCIDAILHENSFTAIMVTSVAYDDIYSFHLTDEMFTRALPNKSQVRLHLIASFRTSQVITRSVSKMKTFDFKRLLKQINSTIFEIDGD